MLALDRWLPYNAKDATVLDPPATLKWSIGGMKIYANSEFPYT